MKALLYYLNAIYDSIVIKDLKETRIIEDNQYLNSDTKEFIMKLTPDLVKLYKVKNIFIFSSILCNNSIINLNKRIISINLSKLIYK